MFFRRNNSFKGSGNMPEQFWNLYQRSLLEKDRGALASALRLRKEAYDISKTDNGYLGMACHNLAILEMYHLGDGKAAAKYARESLDCGEEYYRFSEKCREIIMFGAHLESLQTAAVTSTTYDEALGYIAEGKKRYGSIFENMEKSVNSIRNSDGRFYEYLRATSLLYYSRVSAEQDKGDYAPAMSLLQIIIDHAEEREFDLGYEEYVDVLDDYLTITVMYLMKKARVLKGTMADFGNELAFIADEPLKRLADFLPDCQPSDMKTFQFIIQGYAQLPYIKERSSFRPFLSYI